MSSESGLTERLMVRSFDVDWTGKLKLQSLFQYFQEIAGANATGLGVGFQELRGRGLFWVLSRIKVQITRLPAWGETVELSTWPKGTDRLFAIRDFRMRGQDGAGFIDGTSAWLLVDMEKGRPQRFDILPADIRQYRGEDALPGPLEKLQMIASLDLLYERVVMPGEIDVNSHVNNAVYVGWVMDCFSPEELQDRSIRSLEVNYLDEVRYGDSVAVYRGRRDGGIVDIEITSKTRDIRVLQARVVLQ